MTASVVSDGTSNSYVYDKAGNRTAWMTSQAPDTGEPMVASSAFNAAGQLTAEWRDRPDGGTSIGYSYNGAGQRTQQTATGPDGTTSSQYTYTGDTTTRFGYDGLGRNLTTETETDWGTEETTQVWDGLTVIQQSSDVAGTATMVRDALGQVAVQSTAAGDLTNAAAWSLQDRLGSSIATTTTNGRVTDLSDYSDFGVPVFDSTGWAGSTSYTGELGDATSGLNSYFSRTYDPFAATWLSPDSYRGTLTEPGSQNRYGYVGGNPATMFDAFGFAGKKVGKAPAKVTAPRGYSGPSVSSGGGGGGGDDGSRGRGCVPRAAACSSDVPDRHPPISDSLPRQRLGGGALPYCEDTRLATIAWPDCQVDFRPETTMRKLLEIGLLFLPFGPLAKVLIKILGPLFKALTKVPLPRVPKPTSGKGPTVGGPIPQAVIPPGKWDYLFGKVTTGDPHNTARSASNLQQLLRVGITDSPSGQALLQNHFSGVVKDATNISSTYKTLYGSYEVRESLLQGPGGFREVCIDVGSAGRRHSAVYHRYPLWRVDVL